MTKIDLRKEWKHLYSPSTREAVMLTVPPMAFLMIDGQGDPNTSPAYQEAVEALYALSYGLKFAIKRAEGVDYAVMPLEGLWWAEDPVSFAAGDKDAWLWTAMIMQPEYVTGERVLGVAAEVRRKKGLAACDLARFEVFDEGLAAQVLYVGPYAEEAPTIARLHAYIAEQGYTLQGKHHEIYLGDPRRTAPDRLRTIIRQPAAPRSAG
jgi:hypothetical protein